jgi:hypothetical protein
VANAQILFDLEQGGKLVPAVAQAGKTGWVYVHDRRNGRLLFKSDAFVPQRNLFAPPRTGEGAVVAPGAGGGAGWSPSAYDASRGLFMSVPRICLRQEGFRPGAWSGTTPNTKWEVPRP